MFVSVLEGVPAVAACAGGDGTYSASAVVAYCDSSDRSLHVDCAFAPVDRADASRWEFSFEITVLSEDGASESYSTQDRFIAAGLIPQDARPFVMPFVVNACRVLVCLVLPQKIYRVTKGRALPEKAMRKHHMLTAACEECGYAVVQQGTDTGGRWFWDMQRIS